MTRVLIPLLAASALAACASAPPPGAYVEARNPTELWKPQVAAQAHEIKLAVHAQGLSQPQNDALYAFAGDWRAAGGAGPITLRAPVGGPDAAAVSRSGEAIRGALASAGVPYSAVRIVGYDAKGDAGAPMIVARETYALATPVCGQQWTTLTRTASNQVQPNFGCALSSNMAVQVANPADLQAPSATGPADAQRRMTILDKYRKGETTATARDQQAAGDVSNVVK